MGVGHFGDTILAYVSSYESIVKGKKLVFRFTRGGGDSPDSPAA